MNITIKFHLFNSCVNNKYTFINYFNMNKHSDIAKAEKITVLSVVQNNVVYNDTSADI